MSREPEVIHEAGSGFSHHVVYRVTREWQGRHLDWFEIHRQGIAFASRKASYSVSLPNARTLAIEEAERLARGEA